MPVRKRRYVLKTYVDVGLFHAVHYKANRAGISTSTWMSHELAKLVDEGGVIREEVGQGPEGPKQPKALEG